MVEYRTIAELLRHARFVYLLGATDRLERAFDRNSRQPDAWIGWYLRATLRELGFPYVQLSAGYRSRVLDTFRATELDSQIAYNRTLAERFTTIDKWFDMAVRRAFWLTLFVIIGGGILQGAFIIITAYAPQHNEVAIVMAHNLKPVVTVLSTFLPTLIAALIAIQFQIDFRETAARANSTGDALLEISRALDETESALRGRKYSLYYVRAVNEAMSVDLAGWSNIYRRAPG